MRAIEFLVWCVANPDAPATQMKANYETLCETEQFRLQKAVASHGKPDDSVSKLVGDPDYD